MQYTVVHSKDPYLLARLATDLQMEGLKQVIINFRNPFEDGFEWITTYLDAEFGFYSHSCDVPCLDKRYELTSSNYIKVLTQILQP